MNIESLTTLTPPPLLQLALDFWMLIYLWKIEKKIQKNKWLIPKIQRINGVVAFEFHFI